jgi:hypothetical protein
MALGNLVQAQPGQDLAMRNHAILRPQKQRLRMT